MLLSWAHFEHDRRLLSIYFVVENATQAQDGLSYSGYKFVITYSSFYTVIVDCDSDPDERDNYVHICLRHPPQVNTFRRVLRFVSLASFIEDIFCKIRIKNRLFHIIEGRSIVSKSLLVSTVADLHDAM